MLSLLMTTTVAPQSRAAFAMRFSRRDLPEFEMSTMTSPGRNVSAKPIDVSLMVLAMQRRPSCENLKVASSATAFVLPTAANSITPACLRASTTAASVSWSIPSMVALSSLTLAARIFFRLCSILSSETSSVRPSLRWLSKSLANEN